MKILLSTILALISTLSWAYQFEIDGIYYNVIKSNTTEVISGSIKYSGEVVIPSSIEYNGVSYSVTNIGNRAFQNCSSLTSVTIPNSVTNIGDYAFQNCTGLTNISIPKNVTYIGTWAFSGCSNITSINVDEENKYYDSRNNCNAIIDTSWKKLIAGCKNTVIPSGVTSIGGAAFYNCKGLSNIIIPNSVTSIEQSSFYGCSKLKSIVIPSDMSIIEINAFDGCSGLTSIVVEATNKYFDSRNNCNAIIKSNKNELYVGCKNTIIPNNVTTISNGAFSGCSELTNIAIPISVTSIGSSAFSGCSSLAKVTIPKNVTKIGDSAFLDCYGLSEMIVDTENKYYDSRDNCNAIIESSNNTLYVGCKNTVIPNSVTSIGYAAFWDCIGLTNCTIPNSVTSIGGYAFKGCSGLKYVTIPNSIITIGDNAFEECPSLETVTCYATTLPSYLYYIGGYDHSSIKSATLLVPQSSIDLYRSTSPWNKFGTIKAIEGPSEAIVDDFSPYNNTIETDCSHISYTRTFSNTNWQALYVPFAMNYEDWQEDFEVAEINNFHEYDDDEDGTVDRTTLEIIKKTSGSIEPNTPYLIRAKEAGEKTITLTDATLYKTEANSIDCSSVKTKYTFTGTYDGVSGEEMLTNGYYALAGGALKQAASASASLGAFRWYLKAEPRGASEAKPRANEIKVRMAGTEDDATGIADMEVKVADVEYFTLSGVKVANADAPGVYVMKNSDGTTKKIIKK